MAKGILLYTLVLLMLATTANTQQLKIGDIVPDHVIANVYNYTSDKIKLSQFQKKLVILDFWDTRCGGCIKSFNKIDALQKLFNREIQIILVNRSTRVFTNNFFDTHRRVYKPQVPFITQDTVFQKYFPHVGEPYYVIVDSSGKVLSIPQTINAGIIEKLLANQNAQILQKKKLISLDSYLNPKAQPFVQTSSVLLKGFHSLSVSRPLDSTLDQINHNYLPISTLYAIAYSDTKDEINFKFNRPGRTVVEASNAGSYFVPKNKEDYYDWLREYSYSYHLVIPKTNSSIKYDFMKEDLRRSFDLDVKIENRKLKCLTLVRTSEEDKLESKGNLQADNFNVSSIKNASPDSLRSFINGQYKTFSEKLLLLIEYYFKTPFMDATGIDPNKIIAITLEGKNMDTLDINSYRRELNKYDLDLIDKEWTLEVLVLRDKVRK